MTAFNLDDFIETHIAKDILDTDKLKQYQKTTLNEQDLLERLSKPRIRCEQILKILDDRSKEMGYKNHKDFLLKTGWLHRFSGAEYPRVKDIKGPKGISFTLEYEEDE